MDVLHDEFYMMFALQLAQVAQGQTDINPVVGCVLVRDGAIVGFGAHLKRGEGHAEVLALQMAGDKAKGSTAYVTLEPCCHYGKTPPCADQLLAAGVTRVVVATIDPHERVAGKGVAHLEANGISVKVGVCEDEARRLNEKFNYYITTKLPFVTYKTATSLDGKTATQTGKSKWITGAAAREQVHMMRHQHQAIMVGSGTVLADDPSLTTRLDVPTVQPIRIIVDGQLRIPLTAKVVTDGLAPTWIVTTAQAPKEKAAQLEAHGVKIIYCGKGPRVDLKQMMVTLGELEIGSIFLEGGGQLAGALFEQQLIQKISWFVAPKLVGGQAAPVGLAWQGVAEMAQAVSLDSFTSTVVGDDLLIMAYPNYGVGTKEG
jgi:diaminohydroxyphosphoribosylaminopyrimidine deaminase/5-amino-6-(5-phosphoribosylamino)uracil reductase